MYKQLGAEHFVKIEEKPKQEISHKMPNRHNIHKYIIGVVLLIDNLRIFNNGKENNRILT